MADKTKETFSGRTIAVIITVTLILAMAAVTVAFIMNRPVAPSVAPSEVTLEIPQGKTDLTVDTPKPVGTSLCAQAPSNLQEVTEAPKVVWVPTPYGFYPSNAEIGPGVYEDDFATCWAPTTTGAVAAAYNYMYASMRRPNLIEVVKKLADRKSVV